MKYSHIGKSINRVDAVEKVTGQARFIADIKFPNSLTVRLLRSPYAHALIKTVSTFNADKIPGVLKIVTGKDIQYKSGTIINDINIMASEKVRFAGEIIAAVIAESEEIADLALDKIKVEFDELPAVLDVYEAIKTDAPLVHDDIASNIFHHYKLRKGDMYSGFKNSHIIIANEFSVPHLSHVQLETHGCAARWSPEGMLELTSSSQSPFIVREYLAKIMKLPQSKVRVHIPYVGGGFGGKSDLTIEPLIACLARFVPGRWVRLILTREEAFYGTVLGRGMKGKIKTGVSKDGTIMAEEIKMYFNAGAYGDFCIPIISGGGQNSPGPYSCSNIKVDSYGVYTNTPFVGAFRGYGHPEGNWMKERQLDIIAHKLSMDPIDIRLKNCWKLSDVNHIGQRVTGAASKIDTCIKKAAKAIGWNKNRSHVRKGTKIYAQGISCFMKSPVMATNATSCAAVKLNPDGSLNLSVGTIDIGQGSLTALTQICAERIQLPLEKINISRETDTDFSPYEWQTVASRGTWSVGNAIINACDDAIKKIKINAALAFDVNRDDIIYKDAHVYVKGKSSRKIPIKKLCNGYTFKDGSTKGCYAAGNGSFIPFISRPDPSTGMGNVAAEWTGGCQAVELHIDTQTGHVHIDKFVTVIDAGKIINPSLAKGQITGAVVQGLGSALFEKIIYSHEGRIRNDHLTDYKIPTIKDFADTIMEVHFIETHEDNAPFGARCLGEHGIVSVPSVVANAISTATQIDFFDLPIIPDKLLSELDRKRLNDV
ncbi:xanthine dehydrogenase family protein molybdopterin-binding subunit [Elusimicrobiota bacterium]